MTPSVAVTIRHLAMASPEAFRPATREITGVRLRHETGGDRGELACRCYATVGGPWHWTDHADLEADGWAEWLDSRHGELWVAREGHAVAGYFVLLLGAHDVELRYFGLAPTHIGRGLGGWLLSRAIERAWSHAPRRVTLNTCTLDGPAALPNYLARGFEVVREETRHREID